MKVDSHIREKIIEDIYMEVDGFYVWEPKRPGFFTEGSLLVVVEILKEMNKDWDAEINRFFEEQNAN